jgi:hypothetical protein
VAVLRRARAAGAPRPSAIGRTPGVSAFAG